MARARVDHSRGVQPPSRTPLWEHTNARRRQHTRYVGVYSERMKDVAISALARIRLPHASQLDRGSLTSSQSRRCWLALFRSAVAPHTARHRSLSSQVIGSYESTACDCARRLYTGVSVVAAWCRRVATPRRPTDRPTLARRRHSYPPHDAMAHRVDKSFTVHSRVSDDDRRERTCAHCALTIHGTDRWDRIASD
jgi:hypothetical protein